MRGKVKGRNNEVKGRRREGGRKGRRKEGRGEANSADSALVYSLS